MHGLDRCIATCSLLLAITSPTYADNCGPTDNTYQLLWGDLHIHTAYSMDAYTGGARNSPDQALRFAQGDALTISDGNTIKIDRPLDFAAVTDHAENFGVMGVCAEAGNDPHPYCRKFRYGSTLAGNFSAMLEFFAPMLLRNTIPPLCADRDCKAAARDLWRNIQSTANRHNQPCQFTALIGNEWSSTPNGEHWHRNIIFASDKVTANALNAIDQPTAAELWSELDKQCLATAGCAAITIPHNSNMSRGGQFAIDTNNPTDRAKRKRYDRLAEIFQQKGASECLPEFGMYNDEDCGFELRTHMTVAADNVQDWERLRPGYLREVLKRGLSETDNPLQLGLIGSTDNHEGAPGSVAENTWPTGSGVFDPVRQQLVRPADSMQWLARSGFELPRQQAVFQTLNPGGLVAVWARENTRSAVFEALQARRAYGTSGPRIALQFYQRWVNKASGDACAVPAWQTTNHPMGSTLSTPASAQQRPQFVIRALQDKTAIERLEIYKAHYRDGKVSERLITVATSASGRADVCASWIDPEFDLDAPAFWYARVIEMPTPRWSQRLCSQSDCSGTDGVDMAVHERAWTSPIWYVPNQTTSAPQ